MKVFVSTVPFGETDRTPLDMLELNNIEYVVNPLGRKLTAPELAEIIGDYDALIAGTEPITAQVLEGAKKLRLISRVGIGLDSVDLRAARSRSINVSYTPDVPSPAVAELTVGHILSLLRHSHVSNLELHRGIWARHFGRRITECTIGIIGVGRIGQRVAHLLSALECREILLNDIDESPTFQMPPHGSWVNKQVIFQKSDVVTLHVPLNKKTRGLISTAELSMLKKDAMLVNTSRGGIVNEADLAVALREGQLLAAAIDTFEEEPYNGILKDIDRCLMTAHMGSMSVDCRVGMEREATAEVVRFANGQELHNCVPKEEYDSL